MNPMSDSNIRETCEICLQSTIETLEKNVKYVHG